jgi:hypothetical protein
MVPDTINLFLSRKPHAKVLSPRDVRVLVHVHQAPPRPFLFPHSGAATLELTEIIAQQLRAHQFAFIAVVEGCTE